LSIGQLCDHGCTAEFTATKVTIIYKDEEILHGHRSLKTNGLWEIAFPTPLHSNLAVNRSSKPADLVAFAHASLFSPSLTTVATALRKTYITDFPGLDSATLAKHPPFSVATAKGHMDQSRKNQQSTNDTLVPDTNISDPTVELDLFPHSETDNPVTNLCYAATISATGQVYSDQTGRFIVPSSRGHHYIFLLYCYDSNSIHTTPIKNREGASILAAYKATYTRLKASGLTPKLARLDNECSDALKSFFDDTDIDFQLVPPHNHRRNAAERAIRTFKNHFIAGLSTTDKAFPLHLWDLLLPQADITLNLLRGSRINPKLSAHAQVFGQFSYLRTPLGPPGTPVLMHEKPSNRGTWAPHATEGWYVGPALDSYRCYKIWLPTTRRLRISDTISWFPTAVSLPASSSIDTIQAGLHDILHAIKHPTQASPLPPLTDTQLGALRTLETIFASPTASKPEPPNSNPVSKAVSFPTPSHTAAHPAPKDIEPAPTAPVLRVPTEKPSDPDTVQPTDTAASSPKHTTNNKLRRSKRLKGNLATTTLHLANLAMNDSPILDCADCKWLPTCYKAINPDNGESVEYKGLLNSSDGHLWEESCSEEIGRLAQGYKCISGTNTIHFIKVDAIPPGRKATYLRLVVTDRPQKEQPRRVRFTVGGDKVDYPFDVSTKTGGLTTAKLIINSVVSTPEAKFCAFDIKDFYLCTPMARYEYMRIPISQIPAAIFEQYQLHDLVHNGYVYVEIRRSMYGLPQAGKLANDDLIPHLAKHGYHQCKHTHGLFRHDTRPIMFCLVVDDFGVQYTGLDHAKHLEECIRSKYAMTTDYTGDTFLGMHLEWDYTNRTCDISMPGYIERALQRFEHPAPTKPEDSPHDWIKPNYGAHVQLTTPIDTSDSLSAKETKRLQEVIGTILYYARAIDNTMLVALSSLAAAQSKGTKATAKACARLLNYAATHSDAVIRYKASEMILHIHSDASYLSEPHARSRVGGFFFLGDTSDRPQINGSILVVSKIMNNVLASAAEAEVGGLFVNGQEACPIRTTLEEMGYPQPATPITTDNQCAMGIANDTVKQRRSKAIDMRFYWIRDRVKQGQFQILWKKGSSNLGDYFTKHFPASHHKQVRPSYLHQGNRTADATASSHKLTHCEGVLKSSPTPTVQSPHDIILDCPTGIALNSNLTIEPHNEAARQPSSHPASKQPEQLASIPNGSCPTVGKPVGLACAPRIPPISQGQAPSI
jgi:hypothetical protein